MQRKIKESDSPKSFGLTLNVHRIIIANIDIPEILKIITHANKFLLLPVICTACITIDASMRKKEVYASFEDASCMFRNRGIIIYPIPIMSKVRKPSICSIL